MKKLNAFPMSKSTYLVHSMDEGGYTDEVLFAEEYLFDCDQISLDWEPSLREFAFAIFEKHYYIVGTEVVGFGDEDVAVTELSPVSVPLADVSGQQIDESMGVAIVDLSGMGIDQ